MGIESVKHGMNPPASTAAKVTNDPGHSQAVADGLLSILGYHYMYTTIAQHPYHVVTQISNTAEQSGTNRCFRSWSHGWTPNKHQ